MKKFEDESQAVETAELLYGPGDWKVLEDVEGLFFVTPPTLAKCPSHLMRKVGDVGILENTLHRRKYIVAEIEGELFFQTVYDDE